MFLLISSMYTLSRAKRALSRNSLMFLVSSLMKNWPWICEQIAHPEFSQEPGLAEI